MACNIIRSSDGTNIVVDAKGNPSALYDDLLELLSNYPYVTSELIPTDNVNDLAFQYYELSNSPEFRSKYNLNSNLDVELSIDDIINHISTEYSFNETQNVKEEVTRFKSSITQDDKSYYRGQLKPFNIDRNGNLILEPKYAGWQEEISYDKYKGMGISMSPDLSVANAQGNMFYEDNVNRPQDEEWMDERDAENWITMAQEEGYYVLQIDKSYITENFKDIFDNGNYEQRIGTIEPIIIPKGKFKIENITPDIETQKVKEGVAELFESNPELANVVYESLGFGSFDKTYNYKNEIANKFDADVETIINGMRNVSIANDEDYDIDLELKLAEENGIKYLKYSEFFPPADRDVNHYIFYNDKGKAQAEEIYRLKDIRDNNEYQRQLGYLLQYNLNDVSEFTGEPISKINRLVTPQQKQQAQQLYSQYLDTIFPNSKVKDIVYRGGEGVISKEQYYTLQKQYAERYGKAIPTILNLPNPVIADRGIHRNWVKDELDNRGLIGKDYPGSTSDAIIEQMNGDIPFSAKGNFDVYVIKNENQKHTLGTKQDIERFKKFVSSNVIPEVETNINYQLASNLINPAIEELDNYLLDFLKNFNVKSEQVEGLKAVLGIDTLGVTDVLNKLILYIKNRNEETLPEESAHMIVALMGENHPDIKELMSTITNWSEYNDIKNQYLPIYKDENKVKIEAVGKLIAKALVKNYKVNGLDKNKLQKTLDRILKYIKEILDSISFNNIFMYNEFVADHIAINVLSGNKDYIYKITNLNPNLNAEEEINNNPNAKKIIDMFSSDNVKLTGSLAIAGTENIRRPKGKAIHDIDFKVKSFEVFEKEILSKLPENAVPIHFGWHKKTYSTYAYAIPLEGYKIKVLKRKSGFSNGKVDNYLLYNEKNEKVTPTQQNMISVDFFVYKDGVKQIDFDFSSKYIPATLVYEGKMSLGGKSNPYFFSRDKDQEDYVLRDPKSFIHFTKHLYYQLPNPNKSTINDLFGLNTKIDIPVVDKLSNEDKRNELDILLNAINKLKRDKVYSEKTINTITQMMRDIGFNMSSFEEIVAKSKRPYLKKENAIVDITAKMIHISEGGSVSDLLEEIGHVISAQLDGVEFEQALELIKKDPKYTNEMQKYIAIYQSEEKYTGENAIDKAATEVLGQLIGKQLGDKLEENTDETLIGLIKRFIKRVLGMFKNQFDLHKYVEQSVDYFIKTPNRPFKRETHYYALEEKRNELSDAIVNLKRQRSKVLQLRSKFDKTDTGLFESDKRKVVLDKQITFLTQEIMNNSTDRNVLDYLNEVLNDTNEIIGWLSKYKGSTVLTKKVNITGEEEELKEFISDPNYKDDFNIANVSIRALSDARDYVHNYTYISTILNRIVSNNVRLSEKEKLAILTYIRNIDSRLSFINNEIENLDKLKSQELIETLVTETGASYDYESLPQSIKNTLEDYEQEKDINAAEVWFGPMGMVNSTLSRLVDGLFNLIYNNARIKTTEFTNNFLTKFKSYIGRDMSFVAEKYEGKTTGDFIDEYHWGQWNIARKAKLEELAKDDKYNFPKDAFDRGEEFDSVRVYNDYKKDLKAKLKELEDELSNIGKFSRNTKALKESIKKIEDLIKHYDDKSKVIDDYLEEIGKWYNDNTQPRHNVNEIIDHYRKILSADDFAIWYERNVIVNSKNVVMYYKGELIQPSSIWRNKDYNKLSAEQKRIVSELKEYKKEFDTMIGLPTNTLMPQMYQSMLNSLYDGKLSNVGKNIKGQLQRAFTRTSDDTQFEPDQELRHFQEDNRVVSYIGSRYTKRLNKPEYISTDILGSMIGYAQMAYEFKEKVQRIDQFELLAQKMKKTKFANTSNKLTSNSFEKLTNHLEVHLMGKEEKPTEYNILGVNVNMNKVAAKFNKWISHTNLAFGFITQTANIATSNINAVLETILGQHITFKSSTFAIKEFTKLFTSETIKEFGSTIKNNKLDLMLRYFGLSESADAAFNDLDKNIMMRKPISTLAYAGYEAGAYYINSVALISILSNNRFYDGKLYTEETFKALQNNISFDSLPSAYDSIVVKNGKVEIVGLKPSELNLLINKVRDLSKKLDGKLTKEDYAMAHTNIIGMSALMHRNWIIDGAFRRLKAKGLNFKTGEVDEGYWRTTGELMKKFFYSPDKLKVLANLRANYKKLSRDQQLGLGRTLLDLAAIAVLIAVARLLFNGGDDDDEEGSYLLAYLSNRVLLEVSSFYNPFEIIYAVTDPIVSARQMETLMHLGNALDFEEIERGKWEGYTRAQKYWLSLIPGVKGYMQTQDTESSNQFLKNKQLSWLY